MVRLATFLIALLSIGILLVPRFMRVVVRLGSDETTLVAAIGICFAFAFLALSFGYSVALGAFIAGSLVSESGEEQAVERLVLPVRDMFVAIFFVSVGMLFEPGVIVAHWGAVLVLAAVVIAGKVVAVSVEHLSHGEWARSRGPERDEPRADGRVLLHHRGDRARRRRHAAVSLPGGGGRLGAHHADDAVADPRGRRQ